ncbi:MAG: helix-turn-helix transcriptional regulator [Clostridiales bacterium]|nr:helix-turn-helix transcriptional regulator [Clostridiales bacterium]
MITKAHIKQNLAKAIKSSGIAYTQIAKELGISVQTVSRYANGETLPRTIVFGKLCVMLNLDANEILCLTK